MATAKQRAAARRNVKRAQAAATSKRTIANLPASNASGPRDRGPEGPAARRQGRARAGGPQPAAALRGGPLAQHPRALEDGEIGADRRDPGGARLTSSPVGRILVVNAGSTGMKLDLVDDDERGSAVESAADAPRDLLAVGHRVVHGGAEFVAPVLLDDEVLGRLEAVTDLAPLHNAPALAAIRSTMAALPTVPQVAVFDTAFHAGLPAEATTYAVPRRWREEWGIRRYGFHGLSVAVEPRAGRGAPGAAGRGAAPGGVPPRRRRVRHRRAPRAVGRHHDGLRPPRRPGDGHAQRIARSRDPASPGAAAGPARRGRSRTR